MAEYVREEITSELVILAKLLEDVPEVEDLRAEILEELRRRM